MEPSWLLGIEENQFDSSFNTLLEFVIYLEIVRLPEVLL